MPVAAPFHRRTRFARAPRGHFGTERIANPNQLRAIAQPGQPDVVGAMAQSRITKQPLGALNCLPTFFEWGQIPLRAVRAHDPQSTFGGIEREPPADRKYFDRFVAAQRAMTKRAGGVHSET